MISIVFRFGDIFDHNFDNFDQEKYLYFRLITAHKAGEGMGETAGEG